MAELSMVELPPEVSEPYEVFLNGVPQQAGRDFRIDGRRLVFDRGLAREGRLGFWRWLSLFLGIAGTYRQNDSVDVVYTAGGRRTVPSGLPRRRTWAGWPRRTGSCSAAHAPAGKRAGPPGSSQQMPRDRSTCVQPPRCARLK